MENKNGKTLVEVFAAEEATEVSGNVENKPVRRGRGRPKMEVGVVVLRKNGKFIKTEDGKWRKCRDEDVLA